jgi:hypothetical protein
MLSGGTNFCRDIEKSIDYIVVSLKSDFDDI